MSSTAALYSREVLALATSLARWPLDESSPLHGTARSTTCGSTIELSLDIDASHAIAQLGLRARACAIGQASAAIFADAATGRNAAKIEAAFTQITDWLEGGPLPDWPGFTAIAPARAFPARHGAILLPWRAALVALEQRG